MLNLSMYTKYLPLNTAIYRSKKLCVVTIKLIARIKYTRVNSRVEYDGHRQGGPRQSVGPPIRSSICITPIYGHLPVL